MRRRTFLAAVTVSLAGCTDSLDGPDGRQAETLIKEAINQQRQQAGVATLRSRERLQISAREHSRDMFERDFYAHRNPDGQEPWDRVACNASENIHRGEIGDMRNRGSSQTYNTYDTEQLAAYVADGWVDSRDHYQNMVDSQWRAVGVGVFVSDREFFATAMFC